MMRFNEGFIKKYDEEREEGFILKADNSKNLYILHCDLPFLPERMKINKCHKLACSLCIYIYIYIHIYIHMYIYVVHIRALKQALNHALTLKKVHGVIKFSQKT